jgi:ATP-dependent Clp protease ATP-binding subunit ClpA
MGARPMARLVEQKLKKPLAEAMVFGSLKEGGTALADVDDGDIVLTFHETSAPPAEA